MVWWRDDRKPRDSRYVRAWHFSSDEPSLVFQLLPLVQHLFIPVGSLSNHYDDDDNDSLKKTIVFMSKTTALQVHHLF